MILKTVLHKQCLLNVVNNHLSLLRNVSMWDPVAQSNRASMGVITAHKVNPATYVLLQTEPAAIVSEHNWEQFDIE